MINPKVPNYAFILDWFMYDIGNQQLITSKAIPGDIVTDKQIFLTEVPIPGLNFSPALYIGNGNEKISFTLPLIKRNNTIGNSLLLQQFYALRNQTQSLVNIFSTQFRPNPKVLYYWGTGHLPLIYFVSKCRMTNKKGWVNQIGQPQYSEVVIELTLDEMNPLNKAEELYRQVSMITASAIYSLDNSNIPSREKSF